MNRERFLYALICPECGSESARTDNIALLPKKCRECFASLTTAQLRSEPVGVDDVADEPPESAAPRYGATRLWG